MSEPVIAIELVLMLGAGLLIASLGAGWLIWRSEHGRGRALAELGRAQERARAGEAAAAELAHLRGEAERLGREGAALRAVISGLEGRLAAGGEEERALARMAETLRQERDHLARTLERERAEARGLERQIADLKEAREQMRQAFNEDAGALMQSHSELFKVQNREQVETLLAPLKEDIQRFRKSLGEAHEKSLEQHGSLKEQIALLSRQSADISKEAVALTRALKGNVQKQGAWGEMIVDTILSRLGFREGVEYTRQESFTGEDGRVRTDYIVHLPNGERVIIDSKVSLLDFERYVNADEEAATEHLAAHARSMRAHIKGLADKEYHARAGSGLDFTIMFVPIEAALGAALQHDDAIAVFAIERKIAVATPTTLTTQLQTIRALWKTEMRNKSAEDIARRAGLLYDKFCGFVGALSEVGKRLRQTDAAYEDAMKRLTAGRGNLVQQAEILRSMGASANQVLPKDLLARAEADDGDMLLLAAAEAPSEREPESPTLAVQ